MAQDHRLQQQRFELKYLVEESLTPQIRDFVACHLELDEFGVGQPGGAYPVHSLYLDSDRLDTHRMAVNGSKNRYKLRLRYYNDSPEAPVFFEIKARVDNCIRKQRCGVRRAAVADLLHGLWPAADQLLTNEPRHVAALERFLYLMGSIDARPKAHNCYLREAWVSSLDNSIRVTFDRAVRMEPHFGCTAAVNMDAPVEVYSPLVILGLKFTDRFPGWCNQLVQRFNLTQCSAAKYSSGIETFGEDRFCLPDFAGGPAPAVRPMTRQESLERAFSGYE